MRARKGSRGEKHDFDVFMYVKGEPEGRVGRHRLAHPCTYQHRCD